MRSFADVDFYIELIDLEPDELEARQVPDDVRGRVVRLRALYSWWLANPRKSDHDVVMRDMDKFGLKRMQAYNDLHLIKIIMGDLQRTTKDFARYKFEQMIQRAYEKAEMINDARAMAAAAAAYGKYHQLDKEDPVDNGFDLIRPQVFFPTSDPRVLGLKRIPNIKNVIKKLLKKYGGTSLELVQLEAEDYDKEQLFKSAQYAEEVNDD